MYKAMFSSSKLRDLEFCIVGQSYRRTRYSFKSFRHEAQSCAFRMTGAVEKMFCLRFHNAVYLLPLRQDFSGKLLKV